MRKQNIYAVKNFITANPSPVNVIIGHKRV